MRSLDELINMDDPGWPLVKEWIDVAENKVEVLEVDRSRADDALCRLQVTTRSPMGAIVFMTGGLIIDDGWIRILGSGHSRIERSLPDWNKGKILEDVGDSPHYLMVAYDAAGGFFLLNGGGLGSDLGKVYYFAPDNLAYEPLNMTYTDFIHFCLNNDLNKFYEGYRWTNWKSDVAKLNGDQVFNLTPCLWTKEGKQIEASVKNAVSIDEQYSLNLNFRKELDLDI